jgi:hypothetical protein
MEVAGQIEALQGQLRQTISKSWLFMPNALMKRASGQFND